MVNTITKTTILDGPRNLVVLVNIVGDGSGEETATVLVNRSAFAPTTDTKLVLKRVAGHLVGFGARLLFDGTADIDAVMLSGDQQFDYGFRKTGGISSNRAGAGATGNLLITTIGLGNGDRGTFQLELTKQ